MITVITDKKRIAELHKRFHNQLDNFLTETIDCWVGYPGGNFEDTVKYSPDLNIWLSHFDHDNRFWNGFGIGRPFEGRNNSLNGEINFPFEGINRRIAGVFAEEDNGTILVLHRGRIGGGKQGIGKQYFTDNFRGDFVIAIDEDRESELCLVGELQSPHFSRQVSNFINEIYRVKQIDNSESSNNFEDLNNFNFTNEHSGTSSSENQGTRTIERTHGIVVNELATQLLNRNYKIGNDRNRDLFIHNQNRINALFEIKTSCSTQNLYSAVGQLIIYSMAITNEVALIIVLPEKLDKQVEKRLLEHNIKPLYYEWQEDLPTFIELDKLIA
jgi:hypothetical protein